VHGVWANGVPLSKEEVTLPQVLAENGYRTCASGKVHFEPQQAPDYPPRIENGRLYYGFQEVHLSENVLGEGYLRFIEEEFPSLVDTVRQRGRVPEEAHEITWIVNQAIDFIERSVKNGSPFFCFCSFHELIPPCHPPSEFEGLYDPNDMPLPKRREGELDNKPPYYRQAYEGSLRTKQDPNDPTILRYPDDPKLRRYLASYYDQATFLDKQFGRIVSRLRELNIWDDTIVVFTSDHGLCLNDHWQWRHGPFLYDQVINVPMIWRVPGLSDPEGVATGLVESVDIMPTILDLVGIEPPVGVQGRSFRSMFSARGGAQGRECILAQDRESPELLARGIDPTGFKIKALRTRDWKLIYYPGCPYGELYDLKSDPDEFENLWSEARYLEKRKELEGLLLERLASSEDPLPQRQHEW